jgi:hypothetical protein
MIEDCSWSLTSENNFYWWKYGLTTAGVWCGISQTMGSGEQKGSILG